MPLPFLLRHPFVSVGVLHLGLIAIVYFSQLSALSGLDMERRESEGRVSDYEYLVSNFEDVLKNLPDRVLSSDQTERAEGALALAKQNQLRNKNYAKTVQIRKSRETWKLIIPIGGIALAGIGVMLQMYLKPQKFGIFNMVPKAEFGVEQLKSSLPETPPMSEGFLNRVEINNVARPSPQRIDADFVISQDEPEDLRDNSITPLFQNTQTRLQIEVDALGRRSNINLIFGVLITVAATTLLVYLVSREHESFRDLKDVVAYYTPRITTVALIETFAYFFLGLYKANLSEIKYYQNERTTLTALEIAWRASLSTEVGKTTSQVIDQISKTDRNRGASSSSDPKSSGDVLEIVKTLMKIVSDSSKSGSK